MNANPLTCDQAQEILENLLDEFPVTAADKAVLDGHLGICPICVAYRDELTQLETSLRQMGSARPPEDLTDRIMATIETDTANEADNVVSLHAPGSGNTDHHLKKFALKKYAPIAAAVFVLITLSTVITPPAHTPGGRQVAGESSPRETIQKPEETPQTPDKTLIAEGVEALSGEPSTETVSTQPTAASRHNALEKSTEEAKASEITGTLVAWVPSPEEGDFYGETSDDAASDPKNDPMLALIGF